MSQVVREWHPSLPSTQDRLRELAGAGAPPGSVVRAGEQTAGRGRGGRQWVSQAGDGLWLSVLLPGPAGDDPAGYPLAIGVRLALDLEAWLGGRLAIKWPNDLFAHPGGSKLGGILCESVPAGSGPTGGPVVAVGIGLNVSAAPAGAESLEGWAGHPVAVDEVEKVVVGALGRWITGPPWHPPKLDRELHHELELRDPLRGFRVRVTSGVEGVGAGIRRDGALLVRTDDGVDEVVWSGSVRIEGAPDASEAVYAPEPASEGSDRRQGYPT